VNAIHRLCGRKTSRAFFGRKIHSRYPQRRDREAMYGSRAEARARGWRGCYDPIVCSTEDAALRRVAEAIDRLEADRRVTDTADLEARVAAIWSMVSDIDPELARLASGYRDQRHRVRRAGGDERSAD
jgi:hypothetical protein